MSRHFHAQHHMRGGFDLDVNTIHPNANYWKNSAQARLDDLCAVVGDENAYRMVDGVEGTWREIYNSIKILSELAETQAQIESELADDNKWPSDTINCGEKVEPTFEEWKAEVAAAQADHMDLLATQHDAY